jgi:hypothetical protein
MDQSDEYLLNNESNSSFSNKKIDKNSPPSAFQALWTTIKADFFGYIADFGCYVDGNSPAIKERRRELVALMNQSNIVMVAKVGCGFCENAKVMLREQNQLGQDFSLEVLLELNIQQYLILRYIVFCRVKNVRYQSGQTQLPSPCLARCFVCRTSPSRRS